MVQSSIIHKLKGFVFWRHCVTLRCVKVSHDKSDVFSFQNSLPLGFTCKEMFSVIIE